MTLFIFIVLSIVAAVKLTYSQIIYDNNQLDTIHETYFAFDVTTDDQTTKAILLKPNSPLTLTNISFEASMGHLDSASLPSPDYVRVQSALLYRRDGEPEADLRDAYFGSSMPLSGSVIDFTEAQPPMTSVGGIITNSMDGRLFESQTCQLKGQEDIQNACVIEYSTQYRDTFTWNGQLNLERQWEIYLIVKYQLSNPATPSYPGITVGGKLSYTTIQ